MCNFSIDFIGKLNFPILTILNTTIRFPHFQILKWFLSQKSKNFWEFSLFLKKWHLIIMAKKKLPTAKTLEMHKSCAFTFGQLTNNFTRKLWVKLIFKPLGWNLLPNFTFSTYYLIYLHSRYFWYCAFAVYIFCN